QKLQAVDLGHHDIEHEEIRTLLLQPVDEAVPVRDRYYLVSLVLENPGQSLEQGGVVIGDDDFSRRQRAHQRGSPSVGIRAGSMFPPLTTSTVGPVTLSREERSAAVVAAPEGSTGSPCVA